MKKLGVPRGIVFFAAVALAVSPPVIAQDQVQMQVVQGPPERPFTVIYPNVLQVFDDGSDITAITLRHPDAIMQCDALIQDGAAADWSADNALATLDTNGIVSTWSPDFPGFKVTGQGVTQFQSGPALIYEGESENSPFGVPTKIVYAEAADSGRNYALQCIVESGEAADARPMIDFIVANFSTRSDATCCVDPADPRG